MRRRIATGAAGSIWILAVGTVVGFLAYGIVDPGSGSGSGNLADNVAYGAFLLTFSGVGALLAAKRPGHPIGWLLLAAGFFSGLQVCFAEYGVYAVPGRPDLPARAAQPGVATRDPGAQRGMGRRAATAVLLAVTGFWVSIAANVRQRRAENALLAALGVAAAAPARAVAVPRFDRDPFGLGVASGYPSEGGAVLWTRLITDFERYDGGLDPADVPVRWEVASDEAMRNVVASGVEAARPEWAHSVHVEVKGLAPERWYWYRFMAGDATSPLGLLRIAPRRNAAIGRLRFAFASCQQYEQGYYGAWRHVVRDDPDLVLFLGDYIYESSWGSHHVRKQNPGEPYTLPEYRMRYACYKSDPDLQAAHAACAWLSVWDDHEVDNDYADDRGGDGMSGARFLRRRAAAYRAYYERWSVPWEAQALLRAEPALRGHDLKGGARYFDAQCDDARLTIANIRDAHAHGALLANYAGVEQMAVADGKVRGAHVVDALDGRRFTVRRAMRDYTERYYHAAACGDGSGDDPPTG